MTHVYDFIARTADGVFAVDRRQRIVLWNPAATAILGYTAAEVLGKPCFGIMRGRDGAGCSVCRPRCDAIQAAERLQHSPTGDIVVRNKQGDDVWLSLSTVVVPSKQGELSVLIHVFREVTRQCEVLQAVQDFTGTVSRLSREPHKSAAREDSAGGEIAIRLTRREREILRHLAMGASTAGIAEKLGVSARTVRNHIHSILGKLGVHSRLEAVTFSIRNGLVSPGDD